jgi:hypothetical protein
MGTEAPRFWKQLLEQLQVAAAEAAVIAAEDSSAAGNGWQPSNRQAISDEINYIDGLPAKLPKAVWKKVLGLQVIAALLHGYMKMCDLTRLHVYNLMPT